MAFAKFQENRFRIDEEIAENHAILVNLTASIDSGEYPGFHFLALFPLLSSLPFPVIMTCLYTWTCRYVLIINV